MKAIRQSPTGFSDPPYYESEVEIIGYCYGKNPDAYGYDRSGETVLAIFQSGDRLDCAPIREFRIEGRTP